MTVPLSPRHAQIRQLLSFDTLHLRFYTPFLRLDTLHLRLETPLLRLETPLRYDTLLHRLLNALPLRLLCAMLLFLLHAL